MCVCVARGKPRNWIVSTGLAWIPWDAVAKMNNVKESKLKLVKGNTIIV